MLSGFCDPQKPVAIINRKSPKKIKRSRPILIGWIKNFPTGLFKRLNFIGVFVLLVGRTNKAIMIKEMATVTAPAEINSHKGRGRSYLWPNACANRGDGVRKVIMSNPVNWMG